jgi:hypothetical protein
LWFHFGKLLKIQTATDYDTESPVASQQFFGGNQPSFATRNPVASGFQRRAGAHFTSDIGDGGNDGLDEPMRCLPKLSAERSPRAGVEKAAMVAVI